MSPADAIAVLRACGYAPGVATGEHPHRAEIKAALAVLREHRVAVEGLGLVAPVPEVSDSSLPGESSPDAPSDTSGAPAGRRRSRRGSK